MRNVVWWSLMCEDNHVWEAETGNVEEPPAEVLVCPVDGAPAVTARREAPADRVRIELVSGARLIDPIRGQVGHDDEWFVEIASHDGRNVLRSHHAWTWDDAVARGGRFRGLTWVDAQRRWRRTMS